MKVFKDIFFGKLKYHKFIYIGYSGGCDSSVLLDLVCKILRNKYIIKIIHVNHFYSKQSDKWSVFCKNVCNTYNVILYTYVCKNEIYTGNLEENFRILRVNFFLDTIKKNSTLFLAHHSNDLIETFFMRLFRNSGVSIFNGIQYRNKIGHLNVVRPLLGESRADIFSYSSRNNIAFVCDISNFNKRFIRNYIRFYISPFFKKKIIDIKFMLKHIKLTNESLFYVRNSLSFIIYSDGFNYKCLFIDFLTKLSNFLLNEVIRKWIFFYNYKHPSFIQLIEIKKIIESKKNIYSFIKIDNYLIIKFKKCLYIYDYKSVMSNKLYFVYCKNDHFIFYFNDYLKIHIF
jgi:tRNA(Ile)-lysidine synthase